MAFDGFEGNGGAGMSGEDEKAARLELARLRQDHRDLDSAIAALAATTGADFLQVQRLKKRKLALKDRIGFLEDQLLPDISA